MCWVISTRHMNYLGQIHHPSIGELKKTIHDVSDLLGASIVSPMIVLDKSSFVSIDTNIRYEKLNEIGLPSLINRLEAENWKQVNTYAESPQRFCRDGIVLEFELPRNGWTLANSYPLEVNWGNGEVECKTTK